MDICLYVNVIERSIFLLIVFQNEFYSKIEYFLSFDVIMKQNSIKVSEDFRNEFHDISSLENNTKRIEASFYSKTISWRRIIGPIFFEEIINNKCYQDIIQQFIDMLGILT